MIDQPHPFRGTPPDRTEYVLGQWFWFSRQAWRQALPDPGYWPTRLDDRKVEGRWPTIDRAAVFSVAAEACDPVTSARALVAAMAWGVSTSARERARRLRVFDVDHESTSNQLWEAVTLLRTEGAVAAYDALHGSGSSGIKHLGPSFGTKLLYFAGYDEVRGQSRPLILDKYVTIALNMLCNVGWSPDGGWTTAQYAQYLDLADRWATDWGAEGPDVIERILFSIGKSSPIAIASLIPPAFT